jgi:NAD(P)-dependent dehydrogenase (short-subunit alcohol dehydrogenase family)
MPQTVLITGASTGIGRDTAMLFQAKGWNVVATMRSPEQETELNTLENVRVLRLDVTDGATITDAVAGAIGEFGRIDVLVNNAGFGAYGPLETTSLDTVRKQFDTNVVGLYAMTKAVVPHMRAQKSGTIVNISSMGGVLAFPLGSLYHGSKFAVEGLSEALFYELAAIGVQVKLVEPGMTKTDFSGRSLIFSHDESIPEYVPVVTNTMNGFAAISQEPADATEVAKTIFEAATDGTNRLRYATGADAVNWIDMRRNANDSVFLAHMQKTFSL